MEIGSCPDPLPVGFNVKRAVCPRGGSICDLHRWWEAGTGRGGRSGFDRKTGRYLRLNTTTAGSGSCRRPYSTPVCGSTVSPIISSSSSRAFTKLPAQSNT